MDSHELARLFLSVKPKEVVASVDISTCDEDLGRRVFGDLISINDINHDTEIVLLFEGSLND